MEYMILIFDGEQAIDQLTPAVEAAHHEAHGAFIGKVNAAGVKWDGRQLELPAAATTIRSTDGVERVISDGPYAETKEQLGGYYLIDVADLDAALSWARQVPLLPGGLVEVRPVVAR